MELTVGLLLLQIVAPGAAAAPPPQSLSEKFAQYCRQGDRNPWFCERETPLSDAQKFYVLNGYCSTHPAPNARPMAPNTVVDAGNQSITPQQLCDGLAGVQPLMLVYDHALQQWDGADARLLFRRHGRGFDIDESTGAPVAQLKPQDRIGIVVTHSNPVLYTAQRGTAKEETAEQFAAIPQLLAALGGAIAGVLPELDFALPPAPPPPAGVFIPNAIEQAPPSPAYTRDVALMADADRSISSGAALVRRRLAAFTLLRSQLQLLAQQLERGTAEFAGTFDEALERPADWSEAFAQLNTGLEGALNFAPCTAVVDAFGPVAAGDKAAEIDTAALAYLRLVSEREGVDPDDPTKPRRCRFEYPLELGAVVQEIRDLARIVAVDPEARNPQGEPVIQQLRQRQLLARDAHLARMSALGALLRQLAARRDAAEQVLKKEEDTRKAAAALSVVAMRTRDAGFRTTPAGKLVVSDLLFVKDETYNAGYTKIRVTPLVISLGSPYSDQVTPLRPKETTTSYKLARYGADRFSITIGPIYTGVASPSYVAIDPDPSSNTTISTTSKVGADPAPVTTTTLAQPELKQIAEKDRDPRSGTFAVFANYRFLGGTALGLGGQFGVGLSKDFPSFHYGLAINASKWFTGGFGCGIFRIKALGERNGVQQEVGMEVSGTDDIKLTNVWSNNCIGGDAYYGMISVNILGIPLFSGK